MSEPIRLTRAQVREIDRRAIEQYHLPGIVLMENAARAVVDIAMGMLKGGERVLILCGGGNNGGDGLTVARHLHNRGVNVWVCVLGDAARYTGDAKINWEIVQAMKLPLVAPAHALGQIADLTFDFVVDAMFGTGLTAPPRAPLNDWAHACGRDPRQLVLAIDLPSGMDCDTGQSLGACIRATKTVTFVAEKAGFANPELREYTGEIIVGDIGCPTELIDAVRREVR